MKYRIAWIEYTHHRRKPDAPNATYSGTMMGDREYECWDTFEAADDKAAKEHILSHFDEVEVFNVTKEVEGKFVHAFTEEEL